MVFGDAGVATVAEAIAPAPVHRSNGSDNIDNIDNIDNGDTAWQGAGKRKRPRSRSLSRAQKQKLGTLASQQIVDVDASMEFVTVPDSIGTLPWPDVDAPRGKSLMKYYYRLQRIVPIEDAVVDRLLELAK